MLDGFAFLAIFPIVPIVQVQQDLFEQMDWSRQMRRDVLSEAPAFMHHAPVQRHHLPRVAEIVQSGRDSGRIRFLREADRG